MQTRSSSEWTKRLRQPSPATNFFARLPDHLIIFILCKLAASADSPSDLLSIAITCTSFSVLGLDPLVLSKASLRCLSVRAATWSESTHRFLTRCADAGNLEACYILGMIQFYCLQSRRSGASLMKTAAMGLHPAAMYSLAVIHFNSSGRVAKCDKDLSSGFTLAEEAARLGHVEALRETGHCLIDGYGVERDIVKGRRYLVKAKARDIVAAFGRSGLMIQYLWMSTPVPKPHPANRFMVEWFEEEGRTLVGAGAGLTLCWNQRCGRGETRANEFRRCSVCLMARYCSRTCHLLDWMVRHSVECIPVAPHVAAAAAAAVAAAAAGPPPAEGGAL